MTDRGVVDRENDAKYEIGISSSISRQMTGPVPGEKEQRRPQDVPWYFHDDLGGDEGSPAVHSAGSFPDLVYRACREEWDLELIGERYTGNEI